MKTIEDLKREMIEIEDKLSECETTLQNIGTLAIQIQKFVKMASYVSDHMLTTKAEEFNRRILKLGNLRLKKRQQEDEEMIKCRLQPEQPFTECTDDTYFTEKTHRVNNIISDAMGILDTIQKQSRYIERTNTRLKTGLLKLGLSRNIVNEIDRRYLADYRIFITGVVLVLLFFFVLRFWFR